MPNPQERNATIRAYAKMMKLPRHCGHDTLKLDNAGMPIEGKRESVNFDSANWWSYTKAPRQLAKITINKWTKKEEKRLLSKRTQRLDLLQKDSLLALLRGERNGQYGTGIWVDNTRSMFWEAAELIKASEHLFKAIASFGTQVVLPQMGEGNWRNLIIWAIGNHSILYALLPINRVAKCSLVFVVSKL